MNFERYLYEFKNENLLKDNNGNFVLMINPIEDINYDQILTIIHKNYYYETRSNDGRLIVVTLKNSEYDDPFIFQEDIEYVREYFVNKNGNKDVIDGKFLYSIINHLDGLTHEESQKVTNGVNDGSLNDLIVIKFVGSVYTICPDYDIFLNLALESVPNITSNSFKLYTLYSKNFSGFLFYKFSPRDFPVLK